jgi:hypothetical protein
MKVSIKTRVSVFAISAVLHAAGLTACSGDSGMPAQNGATGTGGNNPMSSTGGMDHGMGGMNHGTGGAGGMDHGSGGSTPASGGSMGDSGTPSAAEQAVSSKAADLRVTVNLLLSEHLVLAAKATGAALGGRTAEFSAYGALLGTNGTDIGDLVGAAFGTSAKDQFNSIWSAHNGFFVDYTTGVATNDQAKKDKAVKDLTETYVPQFADLLSGATGLPLQTVKDLTTEHVLTTKDVVDAQAASDWTKTYDAIRHAFAHMRMIGDPVSIAIAGKLPDAFPGDAAAKSVDFRVALNELLQEHLYLATFATGAALGGRTDEFGAAGTALGANGTDIGDAIGGLYGSAAKDQFNSIWSAHNGFFVDYTTGVATNDTAKKDKAVKDLTETYVPQFAAFLAGATGLPEADLASLTAEHVTTTKAVVDLQGTAGKEKEAADADRTAGQHMQMVADPLATAIVAKMPEKF